MGLVLKRNDGGIDALRAGEYFVVHLKHTPKAMVGVAIGCPTCGAVSTLSADHSITRDGVVTPIWSCPVPPCGVLEWIQLEDFAAIRRTL
jgi:hypothetical protein